MKAITTSWHRKTEYNMGIRICAEYMHRNRPKTYKIPQSIKCPYLALKKSLKIILVESKGQIISDEIEPINPFMNSKVNG